jgi:hypothetical protein
LSDASTLVAVFEDIDIVDDQHRLRRCDRLRDLAVEMVLNSIVFPRTFANEATNPVFVNCEAFADTAESLVISWANQAFNICRATFHVFAVRDHVDPSERVVNALRRGARNRRIAVFGVWFLYEISFMYSYRSLREIATPLNHRSTDKSGTIFDRELSLYPFRYHNPPVVARYKLAN